MPSFWCFGSVPVSFLPVLAGKVPVAAAEMVEPGWDNKAEIMPVARARMPRPERVMKIAGDMGSAIKITTLPANAAEPARIGKTGPEPRVAPVLLLIAPVWAGDGKIMTAILPACAAEPAPTGKTDPEPKVAPVLLPISTPG